MDQNWAEEKKTCNQNGGTRNLLMQYFTPVPYGFICQIKRREKKTQNHEDSNGLDCKITAIHKVWGNQRRGKKNQIRNETKRKKQPSFRKYTIWKVHEAMTIYYIWTAERFDRASEVLAYECCLCTNIQLKAINSSGNNKIVILKQKKRWNISKENILGFSNIRW